MNSMSSPMSTAFERLYCDPDLFATFSRFHPISFARVLPFQEPVLDDARLLQAEEAHLAEQTDDTRVHVIEAFCGCGLLSAGDAANVKSVIDFFGTDFFELMGMAYSNARSFRCALRWYRECIRELETEGFHSSSDNESIHADVGYCLCSLGLFEEAIAWSKACTGPRLMADTASRALIGYEAQIAGGALQ